MQTYGGRTGDSTQSIPSPYSIKRCCTVNKKKLIVIYFKALNLKLSRPTNSEHKLTNKFTFLGWHIRGFNK